MLTIYDWFGYDLPVTERYRMIKQAGFDGAVLWWGNDYGQSDYRACPPLARREGLFIENIHTPFNGINDLWLNNLGGEVMTDILLQCVTDCATFEIPTMVMHLSSGETPPPFNGLGLDRVKRIAEAAENHSVSIALENLRKVEYLAFALGNIDSPRIGFCYDIGHRNCRNPNEDLLALYGPRLMALHLHDNDGSGDQHRLPFDGTIDWQAAMGAIAKEGYSGATALEVVNLGYEDLSAEGFLRVAFERAKRLKGLRWA